MDNGLAQERARESGRRMRVFGLSESQKTSRSRLTTTGELSYKLSLRWRLCVDFTPIYRLECLLAPRKLPHGSCTAIDLPLREQ